MLVAIGRLKGLETLVYLLEGDLLAVHGGRCRLGQLTAPGEKEACGDGGYQGQGEAIRKAAPQAQDVTCRRTRYKNRVDELQRARNRSKSRIRAKVEHPFRIVKRIFGFEKVRYRGLAKNFNRLCACFALGNLYLHRKRLAVLGA